MDQINNIYDYSEGLEKITKDTFWYALMERNDFEFGVVDLKPGQEDTQNPHKSDEVYFITEGDGFLNIDGNDFKITQGRIFYIPKGTPHKFHGNTVSIKGFYVLN
jgi:mannose-6-phosphate isomerase-like protein (cupin superfamily)